MWNSLLKTVLGGAGQAAQKISSYIAPKPAAAAPRQSVAPKQTVIPMSSATNPQAANYRPSSATQSLNLPTRNYTPATVSPSYNGGTSYSSGGGANSYSSNNSVFRNSLSSLVPRVYATSGADIGSSAFTTPTTSLVNTGNTWGDFIKNLTGGLKSILTQSGKQGGTWNLPLNLGSTDFGVTELFGKNKGPQGYAAGVTDVRNVKNVDPNEQAKKLAGKVLGDTTDYSGYNSNPGSTGNQSTLDALNAIDAKTNAQLDQLWKSVDNGTLSQEEAAAEQSRLLQEAQNAVYDQMVANSQAEIPLINQEFDTAKGQLDPLVAQAAADAKATKASNTNTYGAAMRRMVGNRDITQKNINNVYSAAGTAGGSEYLNAISQSERDTANNVAESDRELQDKNAAIDRQQLQFENTIKSKVADLVLARDTQIKKVQDDINMTQAQKKAATLEINSQLAGNLAAIRQQRDAQNREFIAMKQQIVANSGELAKNAVISDSLYGKVGTPKTYNAGEDPNKTGTNSRPVRQFDPAKGKYYYLDPVTGLKIYDTGQTGIFLK